MPSAWQSVALASASTVAAATAARVTEGDAYAYSSEQGRRWTIGTGAIEMAFACRDGHVRLASFRNGIASPPQEYADPDATAATFTLDLTGRCGQQCLDTLWERALAPGGSADPAADGVQVTVQKGDRLGFGARVSSDTGSERLTWVNTLDYGDGEVYTSTDDPTLEQGPLWFYALRAAGTGYLDLLDERLEPGTPAGGLAGASEPVRVPGGYRAPFECPTLGATTMKLLNAYELVRLWQAPRDGTVSVRGSARHVAGSGDVHASIVRLTRATALSPLGEPAWTFRRAEVRQVTCGGRPAVQLDLAVTNANSVRALLHLLAFPRTSVLRQWVEIENEGVATVTCASPAPFALSLAPEALQATTNYWLCGGTSRPNEGELRRAAVPAEYHHALLGEKSDNYVPWMAFLRTSGPRDGWFMALDYLGTWALGVDRSPAGPATFVAALPALARFRLAPGARLELPPVTIGTFRDSLDDLGERVYNWQYEYLWDVTNAEYFCKPKWFTAWFFCSRNLQEQFTARLARLDMDADQMRALGFEMLWDDAGWSKYPTWPIDDSYGVVFTHSYEGPDYAQTLRYLDRMGMKWLLWFCGRPAPGIMDGKVGAWGGFQWRTDGFGRAGLAEDKAFKTQVERFLTANPGCSFHSCDGGSRYAHQFGVQRLADVNYLSDLGRGDFGNHYFSYLDVPDKWTDVIETYKAPQGRYKPETSRQLLTMVPIWGAPLAEADQEPIRRDVELYHYLLREGVAGRWSLMLHPGVEGEQETYCAQRTSHDRTKALLILRHRATGPVTVFPRGLIAEHGYVVGYDTTRETTIRTGADLMAKGIGIRDQAPGELVYLGLPDRPGAGRDRLAPAAPGRVLSRGETNLGHPGIGIYWSPGSDDHWISYYEVRRDGKELGRTATGTSYFDHSLGWDAAAAYAVRTVNGDGHASPWTAAQPLAGEPLTFPALGGHFADSGRDGWSAATTADGQASDPMTWVPPARSPAADAGGTPNQPGGVEGYWEGAGEARVGRGWQQAAADADCVRTWAAPVAGKVRITGRAMKEYYRQALGGPLQVRILHNAEQVWPSSGWAAVALHDLVGATHDFTLDLAAGDRVHFVLGRGASPATDIAAWMPRVAYVRTPPALAAGPVVRVLCGARRTYTDKNGNPWSADRFFAGGKALSCKAAVERASPTLADQPLYQHGRTGSDFTYSIPLPAGLYALRLKFAEPAFEHYFERPLNLSINGRQVLTNLDVCHAARGRHTAHERAFRYLVPDASGLLVLRFRGGWDPLARSSAAVVQAIEVLPESGTALRINCGSAADFVDWNSLIWSADTYCDSGQSVGSAAALTQASPTLYDQALYQTARSGKSFTYRLPVSQGLYTVHLKFAELWLPEPGQRPLNIEVNGRLVRTAWDPAAAAGQLGAAADIRIGNITPDRNGTIEVRVTAVGAHDAILQGIEIE